MMLHMFVLLLLSFLTLFLAQRCHLYRTHHCLPHSKAVALHTCAGYMEYPFQNKEIKSFEENLLATSLVFR